MKFFSNHLCIPIFFFTICLAFLTNQYYANNLHSNSNLSYESKFESISEEYLKEAKKNSKFQVLDYENHPFKDYSFAELKKRFKILDISLNENGPLPISQSKSNKEIFNYNYQNKEDGNLNEIEDLQQLPANFSAFDKWPTCIHPIRNQMQCGGCWAFAATDTLADRLCIASSGRTNVVLSPQDLISCETDQLGCDGGYIERSWQWLINVGVVTSRCFPYSAGYGYVEPCISKCKSSLVIYKKYKASSYRKFAYINDIKTELFYYGPVETGFLVYLDFMNYASGIYYKNSDYLLGGHAVKIIGWGVSNGIEYWIVANSWGTTWGENGYFRFQINQCCNFESNMITGYARLTKDEEEIKTDKTEIEKLIATGKNVEETINFE